jgi:LacI family transcriptional regulator
MTEEQKREFVTQEDVANYVGVSRAVVSYVLNDGPRHVSEETRDRVLEAIQALGYRPNKHAQRLRVSDHLARNSIGIIIGGKGYNVLERSYYSTMLARLFDSAHHLNQHIRFFSFFDAFKDPIFFNKNIHREEISALLILMPLMMISDPECDEIFSRITERIDTILCLEQSIYDLPALAIDLDATARMAMEHLIDLGHRRIAFLSLQDGRNHGYTQALRDHDLPLDDSIVHRVESTRLFASAYDLTLELLDRQPPISAIFCANDEIGIGAMAAVHDRGLKVPDDISIVSVDNTDVSSMVRPALTTVKLPFEYMGMNALEHLLSMQAYPERKRASVTLPVELLVRESTGRAKQR